MDVQTSRRTTRSQTKSEARFINDHTHPLSPGPSDTGSSTTSPTLPRQTLVVKIKYRGIGNAIEDLDKRSRSKLAIMKGFETPTGSPQISDGQHDQQTMQYQASQNFATYNASYRPLPIGQPQFPPGIFMRLGHQEMVNSYNHNGTQMSRRPSMAYEYGVDNGGPVQHPDFEHFQAQPSSAPPLWNSPQSYAPQSYTSQDLPATNNLGSLYDGPRYTGNAHGSVSELASYHGSQLIGNGHGPDNQASSSMASGVATLNPPPMMVEQYQSFNQMPALGQSLPLPVQSSTKHVSGLSAITRAEADLRSVPPAGDELTRLVNAAKIRNEVAKCHNTTVIRYVDGCWMIPQACKSCKNGNKTSQCDRKSPCKPCSNRNIECASDDIMVVLRKPGRKSMSLAAPPKTALPDPEPRNIGESHITNPANAELKKRKRGSGSRGNVLTLAAASHNANDLEVTASDSDDNPTRGKARKLKDDEEYNPGGRNLSPEVNETLAKASGLKKTNIPAKPRKSKPDAKYHINVQEKYPDPTDKPLAWAHKRQPLCETLLWYRAYESAAYFKDGILKGFLVDREVGPRDQFTDQIIISKCGGGKSQDENGKMVQMKNQEASAVSAAFQRAMRENLPVGVIAGQGNSASPTKLPYYYNVLGWFHVTYVWYELIDGVVCNLARLEKIDLRSVSWWAPKGTTPSEPNFNSPKAEYKSCLACEVESKEIFEQGFTCLNSHCSEYFKFSVPLSNAALRYSEAFLSERTEYKGRDPGPIVPPLPELNGNDFGYEERYRKGIVCSSCRCCSRRLNWLYWQCENPGCEFTHRVLQRPIPVEEAIGQGNNAADKETRKSKSTINTVIKQKTSSTRFYDIDEYTVPDHKGQSIGFVRHFKARDAVNALPGGPNDLFMQLQTEDFGLERHASRLAGHVKEVSTSHWAFNFGAAYKYSVATKSKCFTDAPTVILRALKRLTWAGEYALSANKEPFKPFNELLTVGYFEHSHIGFHDDGEKELGPTVATLSLGASATMDFRPKAKGPVGSFRGLDQSNSKGTKTKPLMLSITLNHGDMIIMHGREIQKYYEHAVKPHGKLRYALTSRYIDPARMASDEDRELAAKAGALPAGHEQYDYDGDESFDVLTEPAVKERSTNHLDDLRNHLKANLIAGNFTAEQLHAVVEEVSGSPKNSSSTASEVAGLQ